MEQRALNGICSMYIWNVFRSLWKRVPYIYIARVPKGFGTKPLQKVLWRGSGGTSPRLRLVKDIDHGQFVCFIKFLLTLSCATIVFVHSLPAKPLVKVAFGLFTEISRKRR